MVEEIIDAFDTMRSQGTIEDYAIGGSVALIAHSLPILTDDLDIFVRLPLVGPLVDLRPVLDFLYSQEYVLDKDGHVVIGGVPVHILPTTPGLVEEALDKAVWRPYRNRKVKIFGPEYLVAIMSQLRRPKDLERLAFFLRYKQDLDRRKIRRICARYGVRCPLEKP